jgi:O-antigen/teichoic acid export membrane protein
MTRGAQAEIDDSPAPPPRAKGLMSSYVVLAAATVGGQVLGFIALTLVAHRARPANLGSYGFANSLSSYFGLPVMAGVAMAGIRDLATPGARRREVVLEVQGYLILNGAVAYVALVLLAPYLSSNPESRTLLPLAGLPLIINAAGADWAMQGLQRLKLLALFRFVGQAVYFVVLLLLLTHGGRGVEHYAISNAVGFAATAVLTTAYVWRSLRITVHGIGRPVSAFLHRLLARVRQSFTMALSLVMIQTYYTLDFVLLGYLATSHAVGEYTVASRLPIAVSGLASLWVTAFYPHATVLFHTDRDQLRAQVARFSSLAVLVALPALPVGLALGSRTMGGLFGSSYATSGTAFAILLGSAGVSLVNANIGQVLLACGDDRAFLGSVTVGTILNVGLNIALIPAIGIVGSALATLVAELTIVVAVYWRFVHTLGAIEFELWRIPRALVATAGTSLVALAVRNHLPWWLAVIIATTSYGVLLTAVRAVRLGEMLALVRRDARDPAPGGHG